MPAFEWRRYLDLAQFLQGQHNTLMQEAALRSGVSRAYYAAFCHARNYARDRQGFTPTGKAQDHAGVRTHFGQRGMFQIATGLDHLRQWRNSCDYNDLVGGLAQLLQGAIARAKWVLNKLP